MNEAKQFTASIGGKTMTVETGKLAVLAGGAVTVQMGESVLFATATMGRTPREGIDFFPLTVDFEERLYAAGRIPGSFFRREGRPSENGILINRLTDRPLRPLFPKDMRNDVQIIMYSFSSDGVTPLDILAINGAATALAISDVPFEGPLAAVRVGLVDGEFVLNPTYQEIAESPLDLRLAGTRDAVLMVECGSDEIDEATMVAAIQHAHDGLQPILDLQEEMRAAVGKPKRDYPSFGLPEGVLESVQTWAGDRVDSLASTSHTKVELIEAENSLRAEAIEALASEETWSEKDVRSAFGNLYKEAVRRRILDHGQRLDGRSTTEIRELSAEVNLSPRAHGSGLFTRGETQALTFATLGTPRERQELDGLDPNNVKRYMHHYNFPPFSVGETRFLRGASRRDIGHGALAERALIPVLPSVDEFPYTMRLVTEVLSSNGSTSMASVCASTLALLDTGVPISAPVAGIAMGLIKSDDKYAVLTDIQGIEDHLGDMDFKVAGTSKGINALQMDIKIKGVTQQIMSEALEQARVARLQILETINACMPSSRPALKDHAPRMTVIKIDPEKIGAIIGPGGKIIRGIQEKTGVRIDIEDTGEVFVAAADGPSADLARKMIESLVEEPEIGHIYTGRVVRVTDFGAFVEILPGQDGLVHISQLDSVRIENVEDVAKVGEEITVMVTDIGPQGKIRLSRQAVLEGWTPEEAIAKDRPPKRSGSSGGRGRNDRRQGGGSRPSSGDRNRKR
jgi:polyribonucleotide nucleotidyltransferase